MPISRAFLHMTFRVPSKEAPLQVSLTELPWRERGSISRALLQLSLKVPGKWTPPPTGHPMGPYRERDPSPEPSSTHPLIIHLSLKVSKGNPSMFPQQGPYEDNCSIFRVNVLLIHLYLSESPKRSPHTKLGKTQSPSTEPPHRWQTYLQRGAAWFPKGKIMGNSEHFYHAIL